MMEGWAGPVTRPQAITHHSLDGRGPRNSSQSQTSLAYLYRSRNSTAMVIINDSKISFIWGSCFADHLWGDAGNPFAWWKPHYVMQYNQLKGAGPGAFQDVDFPWYPGQKSAFWRYYLGGQGLGDVRGGDAWDAMVPFRIFDIAPHLETDKAERIVIDTYAYELGVVIVLTVQPFKRAKVTMDEWVARLQDLRNEQVYLLDNGSGAQAMTIKEVMASLASNARSDVYGSGGASVSSTAPITIANILQAEGGQPGAAVDVALQRYLHAVTAWPDDWKNVNLPPLETSPPFLPQRSNNQLPNDVLYSVGRGLAIWRPGLFARPVSGATRKRRHTLSCFGHNLCAAAAQAEYLRLFAMIYAAQQKLRERFDVGRARTAGALVDALLRGDGTTYRSESVRQILADRNSQAQVNQLLKLAEVPTIS